MFAFAAQAQQVVINKTDGTSEVFQPNEVDSVVYKPAPKYYYYAGWECPKNEAELAKNGHLITGDVNQFTYNFAIEGNEIANSVYGTIYFIIPVQLSLYDNLGTDIVADQYDETLETIGGVAYRVLSSKEEFKKMNFLNIKKKR